MFIRVPALYKPAGFFAGYGACRTKDTNTLCSNHHLMHPLAYKASTMQPKRNPSDNKNDSWRHKRKG